MKPVAAARILVVDDNDDNRYTLGKRLERLGHTRISMATNGREALALLREQPFDLMLLDVMMPEMNGYEVLEQVKADVGLRHIPVIMISALDDVESVIRCIELGAEDYLPKPFNPTLLRARIGASLERKRLQDEVAAALARLEHELQTARRVQLGMMPPALPAPTGAQPVDVYATLQPARQVGGDFYDFFYCGEQTLCVVIADVCDKGAPAALFMATAKTSIRVVAALLQSADGAPVGAADIVASVNQELCRDNRENMFVTLVLGLLDLERGSLSYCNGGHGAPYIVRSGGELVPLEAARCTALGVDSGLAYRTGAAELAPGDCLFLFTDGVTEAVDVEGGFFEEHRLEATLRGCAGASARQTVEAVLAAVQAFAGEAQPRDDIAAVAVRLVVPALIA